MTVRTSSMVFALSALSLGAVVLSQSAHIVPLTNKMSQLLGKAATFESLKDANIAELKQKVSAKYDGSPVEAVLEGLSLGSISLKSKPGAFEGRKFWMDYSDLTLAEVMDHIAEMANARWERSNSTYTLVPIDAKRQESDPSFAFASEPAPEISITIDPQDGVIDKDSFPFDGVRIEQGENGKSKAHLYDAKQKKWREMTDAEKKQFEAKMKIWSEKFSKDMEKWGEEFGRKMEVWGKSFGETHGKDWEKHAKEWEQKHSKEWEKWAKEWEKNSADWEKKFEHFHKLHGSDHEKLTDAQKKELEQMMKELNTKLKSMPKIAPGEFPQMHFESLPKLEGMPHFKFESLPPMDMKVFENGKQRELTKEERAKLEAEMKKLRETLPLEMKKLEELKLIAPTVMEKAKVIAPRELPAVPRVRIHSHNGSALLESMTPEQSKLMESRGYLTVKDLTNAQKELLGELPKGDFTISYTIDGKSITIKSEK